MDLLNYIDLRYVPVIDIMEYKNNSKYIKIVWECLPILLQNPRLPHDALSSIRVCVSNYATHPERNYSNDSCNDDRPVSKANQSCWKSQEVSSSEGMMGFFGVGVLLVVFDSRESGLWIWAMFSDLLVMGGIRGTGSSPNAILYFLGYGNLPLISEY